MSSSLKVWLGTLGGAVLAAVIGGVVLTWVQKPDHTTLVEWLLKGHLNFQEMPYVVAQSANYMPEARDLGVHDICTLTGIDIQKIPDARVSCELKRVGNTWQIGAKANGYGEPGRQAICTASCADFK